MSISSKGYTSKDSVAGPKKPCTPILPYMVMVVLILGPDQVFLTGYCVATIFHF
ncbi:hypothetical protein L484_016753 [Morus notabilis]|uniref:Uncharacterized protein n=1 Tax=Morus notabilis TaxID=981085 RepID=W9QVK3_9ROSA|nr:hypothetical protein L484_016753 [Morus notabilis]